MTGIDSAALNWQALVQEAKRHLQALLSCDTMNPPGNEVIAATYLREQLVAEGMLAMELTLFLHFARQVRATGQSLGCDLLLLSVADEEPGSKNNGKARRVEHDPELVDAEYALNEGGGMDTSPYDAQIRGAHSNWAK